MSDYFVSIIIPTYHDWARLKLCLEALNMQSYGRENFEIIVINNDPADKLLSGYWLPQNCSIIEEAKSGSYAARNAGLRKCKGEIVGFTDSDCVPDFNWIANAVEFLKNNTSVSRVTGPVKIFSKKNKPTAVELYDSVYAFPQKEFVKNGVAVTANLFTYKEVFYDVGEFNSGTMSGGDLEWGSRAQLKGYQIEYCENVIVNHPARDTFSSLFIKAKRVGKGKVILENIKKRKLDRLADYLVVFKPKLGETKRVLFKEKGLNIFNRIYLLVLRHMILWTSEFWKLNHSTKQKKRFWIQK